MGLDRKVRKLNAAACYSPTPSRVQYHRRDQALASGFGKGPGVSPGHDHRKTNITANPDGPAGRTGTMPRFRSWRSGNRTTDANNQTLHRYRHRDHKKQCSLPSNERNHHRTRPDPASGSESVPRSPVSTGRLHPSRGFHLRPIEHVFNMRATDTEVPRNPNLGAGFPLRCFQRLSLPNVANRPCRWRDNRHTRGPSTQVLSYYGQASSGFQRAQRIETKLSHDVLNPARVPL